MSEINPNQTRVLIGEARFSFLHVFKPRAAAQGADPKYSVMLLLPKEKTDVVGKIRAAIRAAYEAKPEIFNGKKPDPAKIPLKDGDTAFPDRPECAGCWVINASAKTKPGIVKRGTVTKFTEITDENELWSGCYGYASVNFYAYSQAGNRGIGAGLNNLLLTRTGDYLGGRTSPESDFDGLDIPDAAPEDLPEEDDLF